jgi:hypothetical protein
MPTNGRWWIVQEHAARLTGTMSRRAGRALVEDDLGHAFRSFALWSIVQLLRLGREFFEDGHGGPHIG